MGKLLISFTKFRFDRIRISLAVLAFTKGKREDFLQTSARVGSFQPKFTQRSETVNPDT